MAVNYLLNEAIAMKRAEQEEAKALQEENLQRRLAEAKTQRAAAGFQNLLSGYEQAASGDPTPRQIQEVKAPTDAQIYKAYGTQKMPSIANDLMKMAKIKADREASLRKALMSGSRKSNIDDIRDQRMSLSISKFIKGNLPDKMDKFAETFNDFKAIEDTVKNGGYSDLMKTRMGIVRRVMREVGNLTNEEQKAAFKGSLNDKMKDIWNWAVGDDPDFEPSDYSVKALERLLEKSRDVLSKTIKGNLNSWRNNMHTVPSVYTRPEHLNEVDNMYENYLKRFELGRSKKNNKETTQNKDNEQKTKTKGSKTESVEEKKQRLKKLLGD